MIFVFGFDVLSANAKNKRKTNFFFFVFDHSNQFNFSFMVPLNAIELIINENITKDVGITLNVLFQTSAFKQSCFDNFFRNYGLQ